MWRRFIRIASIVSAIVIAVFLNVAFVVLLFLNKGLPSIDSLKNYEPKEVSQVFSASGEVIGEFFEEKRFVNRDVPEFVKNAFIAAEDSNFYVHRGVDFLGVLRAVMKNALGGHKQGASTITQQVARGFLLTPERTYKRKIKEMILSWQIENSLTKEEILHLYLNHIYLGASSSGPGAYGVDAAARVHFGKPLREITIAEAAILAGLPKAPNRYSPAKNPERAKRRQLYVLKQMLKGGYITSEEYEAAVKEEVLIERPVDLNKTVAPYFVETVRQYVMNKYGSDNVLHNGMKIYTTLDADMNRYGQNALRRGLSELEKRQGFSGPIKKLKPEEVADYFKIRSSEDKDDDVGGLELEVSASEAKNSGAIRMRPPRRLEVGDVLEGVVKSVSDEKKEALVEYEPNFFARLKLEDMLWAHDRVDPDDDSQSVSQVTAVSQVLKVGYVVPFSVKALPKEVSAPIEGALEQRTEVEGAVMAIDPHSGFIKAMVGGYDFNRSQFNRAIQAKRQPGSSFKPVVYAAALDLGFTPASLLQDSPITFENAQDQEKWRPSNYDQRFVGDITLRNSLITSRNITTIRLLNEIGITTAIDYARRLGIESPINRDFTMALGSSVAPLQEMLQPYVVFATQGYRKSPISIQRIVDRKGVLLEQNVDDNPEVSVLENLNTALGNLKREIASIEFSKPADLKAKKQTSDDSVSFLQTRDEEGKKKELEVVTSPLKPGQVLSTEASFLMTYLLKENVLYGTGRQAAELQRPASGKTGTTDENRDAWFIGFTPDLVTGVWVGYDDQRILGRNETGSKAAVPIWLDFMARATAPYPKTDFSVPDTIEFVRIDPKTGGLANPKSKTGVFEAFVKGTAPTKEISPTVNEMDLYQLDQ